MTSVPTKNTNLSENRLQVFKSPSNHQLLSEIFTFDSHQVTVLGTVDKPLFIGKEICDILGYSNITKAIKDHVEPKWKMKYKNLTDNHPENNNWNDSFKFNFRADTDLIGEPGLYSLIFSSKLKKARKFRDKVFEEVLPSIRKTGEYKINQELLSLKQEVHRCEKETILTKARYEFKDMLYSV